MVWGPNPFGEAPILYKAETDSTQRDAAAVAAEGAVTGTVVITGYQREGRGRLPGRSWQAKAGESLLFTLVVRPQDCACPPGFLPLAAGLALALTLEERYGLEPSIKWPNDVLVGGKKIAGILCEGRNGTLLAGMGVNCRQRGFEGGLDARATSLSRETGALVSPESLLVPLLRSLQSVLLRPHPWIAEIRKRLYRRGEVISFQAGLDETSTTHAGVLEGIDEEGLLLLKMADSSQVLSFSAGEIRWLA